MTVNEILVESGKIFCPDGRMFSPVVCKFCMYSRYFVISGKQERSPSLSCCLRERITDNPDVTHATAVGCAANPGTGYTCIGNIIS